MAWWLVVIQCILFNFVSSNLEDEKNSEYWNSIAREELKTALEWRQNTNVAKNIILFIGDGMGIPTIMAARTYYGQKKLNITGEEAKLSFEKFPFVSLIKTYSVSKQVPDSAATATSILTGVKTKSEMIGVTAKTNIGDCNSSIGNELESLMLWAQQEKKDTGIVTTTRITHATPAAMYAHTAHRDWESDADMPQNASKCIDIARQLVERDPGKLAKVIFGGGRRKFLPSDYMDMPSNKNGQRKDGRNLIKYWQDDKKNRNSKYQYVSNLQEFNNIDVNSVDYVLGLFNYDHMQYEIERNSTADGEPSLSEMTAKAISILQKNKNGFFLLVEGGRIDHAHHETKAIKALEDTVALSDAVDKALSMTKPEDTLILVTADHSHVMTINGYANRGNPIMGIAGVSDVDNKSYTTLMYTNGPGYRVENGLRAEVKYDNFESLDYLQLTALPLNSETHGGEDVALYATGPMAHLFHGVHEQNYIAHVMAYASCVGANKEHCIPVVTPPEPTDASANLNFATVNRPFLLLIILTVVVVCT